MDDYDVDYDNGDRSSWYFDSKDYNYDPQVRGYFDNEAERIVKVDECSVDMIDRIHHLEKLFLIHPSEFSR